MVSAWEFSLKAPHCRNNKSKSSVWKMQPGLSPAAGNRVLQKWGRSGGYRPCTLHSSGREGRKGMWGRWCFLFIIQVASLVWCQDRGRLGPINNSIKRDEKKFMFLAWLWIFFFKAEGSNFFCVCLWFCFVLLGFFFFSVLEGSLCCRSIFIEEKIVPKNHFWENCISWLNSALFEQSNARS